MISKEIKFLLTHSSIYGLGTVVSQLVAFLLLPVYTRYLTPTDYGVLETIGVSSGIIGLVVTVGIVRALSRFYYESDEETERNKVVSTTYITYSVIACLVLPLLFLLSDPLAKILFKSQHYGHFFEISFLSLILGGVIDIGMVYLRLIKKSFVFITITTTRLILLIAFNIFFIVHLHMGVVGILYSSLIVRGLYALVMTALILWKTKVNFSFGISRQLLKFGLPMIPSNLGTSVVRQSSKYFVLYFLSIADVGIYSLALRLGNAIHTLATVPFIAAYIPRRFEIMHQNGAREIYSKIFTYYIFIVVYLGLALSILIPEILQIMVTPKFLRAGDLVPLVTFYMIILGCHAHFDFGILYSKKTKYLAYINVVCAVIRLGLNYVLILIYGLFGVLWAAVITYGIQALLLYFFSGKFYHIAYEFRRILSYVLIAVIFYGISTQIHADSLLLNVGIKITLLILFPVVINFTRIISPKEKAKLRETYTNKIKLHIRKLFVNASGS